MTPLIKRFGKYLSLLFLLLIASRVHAAVLRINSFYASPLQVEQSEQTTVYWDISGADTVSLYIDGKSVEGLDTKGSYTLTVSKLTPVKLKASMSGTHRKTEQELFVVNKPPKVAPDKEVSLSDFAQPLRQHKLDIVQRASLITPDFIVVATHDNQLYRISRSGLVVWQTGLEGVLVNQPNYYQGILYFTLSVMSGDGRLCKAPISTGKVQCTTIAEPTVATPMVLANGTGHSLVKSLAPLNIHNKVASASTSVQLMTLSTSGVVSDYGAADFNLSAQFRLPQNALSSKLLSNPQIINNELIVRTGENQVTAFFLPTPYLTGSRSNKSLSNQTSKAVISSLPVLDIAWQREVE